MVSPARRRNAVSYLQRRHRVSERRACALVGQHRSTQRYRRRPPDFELRLVARMNALAERHPATATAGSRPSSATRAGR